MNRIHTLQKLSVLAALTLLFSAIGVTTAQDMQAPSGMSGKVVNLEGEAVAGFTFSIQPMQLQDGQRQPEGELQPDGQEPPEGVNLPGMPRQPSVVRTDVDGTFTVTGIQPGFIQLEAISDIPEDMAEMFDPEEMPEGAQIPPELIHRGPFEEPDKTIFAIQIGKVIVFNNAEEPVFFEGITFALEPGKILENVKIIVKSRLRIHARIVYADGTPLVNADGQLNIRQRDEFNPQSGGSHGMPYFTDADGYFTEYMDIPGFYTISVKYSGAATEKELSAGIGPFLLMVPKAISGAPREKQS